ncbi:MAG TPA: hypothetical protein PKX27_06700 [Bacteroidales bacterium]|nr:hypothetical protein [Bacteroidales bacterium]HQM68452.1 hypothetical protein [Bacteroidales bacterium]
MDKEEHISIKDLINFAKRSGPDTVKDENEMAEYERIALHLGDCAECLERLAEIRYTISDYDKVWSKIFPSGAFDVIEQKAIPESKVLDWISEASIIRELEEMLADIGNMIRTNLMSLAGYNIPAMKTTYGSSEIDSVPMYYLKSSEIDLIDSVELKDNNLVFHFSTDTGYNKICIAGPDQIHGIADIINYNPGEYSATFSGINSKPEGLFVHLY